MTKIILTFLLAFFAICSVTIGQVAINETGDTPDPSAMLDVSSTDKGLLIPRLTTAQRNTLATSAVAGLMVYDTDLDKFFFHNGITWESGSVGNLFTRNGAFTYLTNTSDFVGIGTSSPTSDIEIYRTNAPAFFAAKSTYGYAGLFIDRASSNDNAYVGYRTAGSNKWFAGMIKDDNFSISTSFSTPDGKFYIENTGNVGIGTTAPGAKLDVSSSGEQADIRITRPSSTYAAVLGFYTGTSNTWNLTTSSGNNNMLISRGTGNTTGNLSLLSNGGYTGIGTNTPARTLEVTGSTWQVARISSSSVGAAIELKSSNAKNWAVASYSGALRFLSTVDDFAGISDEYYITSTEFRPWSSSSKNLGSTSARWTNVYSVGGNFTGNVGIGITSPTEALHVVTTGDNRTAYFTGTGTGIADATVYSENTGTAGIAGYFESNGTDATMVIGQNGTGPFLKAFGPNGGNEELRISNDGTMSFYNSNYTQTILIDPSEGTAVGGQITMYNSTGAVTIEIDGDYNGDGRITTQEIQITGGSDLSEFFDLSDYGNIEKGMVVSIDENNPGHLILSSKAYDRKVAGIISGANEIEPGLIMSQKGTIADGEHLVALSGRVYCMVDATEKPIAIGDMLTTSSVQGHAMKVEDFDQARGAIIGKAMTSLDSGKGLVLVLVSLQ